jgi:hypothetical protein
MRVSVELLELYSRKSTLAARWLGEWSETHRIGA